MKKAVGIIITVIVIAALGGAGYFFVYPQFTGQQTMADDEIAYATNVGELVNGFSFNANRYSGVVETQELIKIDADSDKKIKTTYVKEGDTVKAGDKLFEYDLDEMTLQLEQYKLDLAQAEAEIKGYNEQITAIEKEKKGASSNKQLALTNQIEALKLELKKAEYNKSTVEKSISKIENATKNSVVKASVNGTISSVDDPTADSYILLASDGDLRIKATVSEENIGEFFVDESILIRSRIDEELTWKGKVTSIDTAKPVTSTSIMSGEQTTKYPVYILIENSDGLMIGQHVTVEMSFDTESDKEGLWLDDCFVADADTVPYVWAENADGTLEKRPVELGEYDEDLLKYEIKSGITTDDYIVFPEERLVEGMPAIHLESIDADSEILDANGNTAVYTDENGNVGVITQNDGEFTEMEM